jgi:hypothetical protein
MVGSAAHRLCRRPLLRARIAIALVPTRVAAQQADAGLVRVFIDPGRRAHAATC